MPGARRPGWQAGKKRTREPSDMEPDGNVLSAAHFLEEGAALRHVAVPAWIDSILYGHLLGASHSMGSVPRGTHERRDEIDRDENKKTTD